MRIWSRTPLLAVAAAAIGVLLPSNALAGPQTEGTPTRSERLLAAPTLSFRLAGGQAIEVSSLAYDRAEVAPLAASVGELPHGSELSRLKVYVATRAEVATLCGEERMACYDPVSERMTIDGEDEEVDGISRASVIAHEYAHHIANNRAAGIWPAFDAGTLRWSTYEHVCERKREGLAFPGNEGAHYWENPGEAFAQSFSQLVDPSEEWNYSPLFRPDPTALRKLREDVVEPVEPKRTTWVEGVERGTDSEGLAAAVPASSRSFAEAIAAPYDGRVRARLRSPDGGRYRLSLVDLASGEVLAQATPRPDGSTRLRYADCGHRQLELEATALGKPTPFEASLLTP